MVMKGGNLFDICIHFSDEQLMLTENVANEVLVDEWDEEEADVMVNDKEVEGAGANNMEGDDDDDPFVDWESNEPQVEYMHADEDELIGFKKCEGSDSDEDYEPDEVDETVDGNDTTVEEEGGMNEGELSDGAMGDYPSGDDDLQEEGTFIGDEFEENQEGEEGDFAVGQVFGSIEELRVKMKDYVMRRGITMVQDRNEPKRYTVHCAAKKKVQDQTYSLLL
ncbi:hypothetical protein OROHE_022595 [Orobanche hederae]